MKKLYLIALLCFAYTLNAQTLSYNEIGVLFSKETINGTARYNAMSGAFGALGGDLSAIETNPAGAAVFLKSEFSTSFDVRNTKTTSTYYGNNEFTDNDFTNLSQAGGVFVFSGNNRNSGWGKVALGFNFSIANDFENLWFANGNSNYPTWIDDPDENNTTQYLISDGQYFENFTNGQNNKYTFTFASQYEDNLYIGASISTYDVSFYQRSLLEEYNSDSSGNLLDASLVQELATYGDGFSFNVGIISKLNENLRIGLAYQSPVWYSLGEDYLEDTEIYVSNTNETIVDNSGLNAFDYNLRTPSKLTGSLAYIFSKQGLLSVDYIYKNYSKINLNNANFTNENLAFANDLKSVGELRIGTEWRFDNLSLRGGYFFEKDPYKDAISSDNIEGYSVGAGLKFRGVKLDFAYQNSTNTRPYNFYPQYNEVNSAELAIDNSRFTATLVLNL